MIHVPERLVPMKRGTETPNEFYDHRYFVDKMVLNNPRPQTHKRPRMLKNTLNQTKQSLPM